MAGFRKAATGLATELIGTAAQKGTQEGLSASGRHVSKELIDKITRISDLNPKSKKFFTEQPIQVQDYPALNKLYEDQDIRLDQYHHHMERMETPSMIKITDDVNREMLERSQKAQVQRELEEFKNPRNPEEELAGLKEKYIASTDDTDHQRIIQDGLAQDEDIQNALAGIQRAKDRGSARGQDTYTRILRQKKGTAGSYIEEQAKEFVGRRADMQGRLVKRDAYGKPIAEGAAKRGEYPQYPGQKPSKKTTSALKETEGLEALIEQHHMMSAYDSSVLADQLGKLGHRFKYNAYMYILQNYKMLPGDFDLNIANIPAGPHRLKSGNLHAWLNDMGFEEYWREFAKANPGTPDPNKMMEAIDRYFDEVFYPALIKMDALVQQAPNKYKWDGLYIAPYLLKDAKARVKHLNKTYSPEAKFKEGSSAYETALDAKHDFASQQGFDTQKRTWETSPDGLPLMSREGFPKPKKSKKKSKK